MQPSLADDISKNIVIYVNDFYPEFASAFTKLSEKLGRPLRGIMLIDAERKASGKYRPDKDGFFEELVVDFSDDGALRKAIKPLENHLLLVSCDSEAGQLYFKQVIPHIPYVYTPTESSITYCTDKGKMREMLLAYDRDLSPRAIVVHDVTEESVKKVCRELKFPLIIKPTNLSASLLVNKVNTEDELYKVLKRSFAFLDKIYSQHRGLGDKTLIVEEFVEGDLFSVDAYVNAIGKVYILPFIHFQNGTIAGMNSYQVYQSETYHKLGDQELQRGIITAEKAMHAVGLRSSVAHIELFHMGDNWKIIELGARPGGWRQEMYELSYGIDHAVNELLIKIGREPEMPSAMKMHSTTFKIHAPKAGIITSIAGTEKVRNHPQMYSMHVNVKPGDKVLPSTDGGEVLIDGLMYNADHEQLDRDIATVRTSIQIDIKQEESYRS